MIKKSFWYIKREYGINPEIGMRVEINGRGGVIIEDCGPYIGVNFNDDKPGECVSCHPISGVTYFDEIVKIRKPKKSSSRFADFISSDIGWTFKEWLKYKEYRRKEFGESY
jgi:hypothetical protein